MEAQREIILEHTFPSGVHIDEDFEIDLEYIRDIVKIDSIENVKHFADKWKYLFPHLLNVNFGEFSFEEFVKFRRDPKYQEDHFNDAGAQNYLDILLPYELLKYYDLAFRYKAPLSIVMLQVYSAGLIREKEGYWFMMGK